MCVNRREAAARFTTVHGGALYKAAVGGERGERERGEHEGRGRVVGDGRAET